jgi:hypothetical protein
MKFTPAWHRCWHLIEAQQQQGAREEDHGAEIECRRGAAASFRIGAADHRAQHHGGVIHRVETPMPIAGVVGASTRAGRLMIGPAG